MRRRTPRTTRTDTLFTYTTLFRSVPKTAVLIDPQGGQREVLAASLDVNDHVLVRPGDRVSADGVIIQGASSLDERSEEHTSELQSLMRISYAVFCLKKKKKTIECINNTPSVRLTLIMTQDTK